MLGAILVNLLIGGLVAYSSWWSWHSSRPETLKRQMRAMKRLAINEVTDGSLAKIVGKTLAGDKLLTSPLSQRPCVAYEIYVEEIFPDSEGPSSREVGRMSDAVPFLIKDETGEALIEASKELVLDYDRVSHSSNDERPFLTQKAMLDHFKLGHDDHYKYYESILEPGERVAVSGVAFRDPSMETSDPYRGSVGTRLRIVSSRRVTVTISEVKDTFG